MRTIIRDWKTRKLNMWDLLYGTRAEEWDEAWPPVEDDRKVFIETYRQIREALESLPEDPHSIVRVAMSRFMREVEPMMDDIKRRFERGEGAEGDEADP